MKARTKWGRKLKRKIVEPRLKTEGTSTTLSGPFKIRDYLRVFAGKRFVDVNFREGKFIDLPAAEAIASAVSIRSLGVWSRISRSAFSRLMEIGGLKEVFVFNFAGSGRLRDFKLASELEVFRSFETLHGSDIIEIANLPKLHTLTAHTAEFGVSAMERLVANQTLRQVDFEAVKISDLMAAALAKSRLITDVVLPATGLSKEGLKSICAMPQLRYLDIWANRLDPDDLDMLAGHPSLEILELGNMDYDPERSLKAEDLISKLDRMPKLNTVYFENVITTDDEFAHLQSRYKFRLLQEDH